VIEFERAQAWHGEPALVFDSLRAQLVRLVERRAREPPISGAR